MQKNPQYLPQIEPPGAWQKVEHTTRTNKLLQETRKIITVKFEVNGIQRGAIETNAQT